MPEQRFLGVKELSEYLGIPAGTLRQWVHLKKLPYVKMGKSVKFDLRKIEEWVKEREVEPLNI